MQFYPLRVERTPIDPKSRPDVVVYDPGVIIVSISPDLELRGLLIEDNVWFAWFLGEQPLTAPREAAQA
jgi:hypothetical protein